MAIKRNFLMNKKLSKNENKDKWDFSDYAFTITGILVGVLLLVPEILYAQFGISILGGSMGNISNDLVGEIESAQGLRRWTIVELRSLSPMLFLLTTTIVFFEDAISARKTGGYKGAMFTHTFESLFEESIYMAITTIMVYTAILTGTMFASWLAGPITWILFICIIPLVRKKHNREDKLEIPKHLLIIFIFGVTVEIVTRAWIVFPISWMVICIIELVETIRDRDGTLDTVFNIIYYTFSVILLALGIAFDFWMTSWAAFPVALFICWIISKFGKDKKSKGDDAAISEDTPF